MGRERGEDLRARLLDAAIQQIRERGVVGFSLRGTARAVGVDPAMVYRQFADKAELVESVAIAAFGQLAQRSQQAVEAAGPDPLDRLYALGHAYVRFALDHATEFEIMFAGGRRTLPPASGPSAYDQLHGLLTALDEQGRLVIDVDDAALMCWSSVHGVAWLLMERGLVGYPASEPREVVDTVLGHLLRFLVGAGPPRGRS